MLKRIVVLSFLCLFFLPAAFSAQNKYKQPTSDRTFWKSQFTVLLVDDADAKKTRQVIDKTVARDFQGISVSQPLSYCFLFQQALLKVP